MKNTPLKKKIAASVIAASLSATTVAPIASAQEQNVVAAPAAQGEVAHLAAGMNYGKMILDSVMNNPYFNPEALVNNMIRQAADFWKMILQVYGSIQGNIPQSIPGITPSSNPIPNPLPKPNPAPSNRVESIRTGVVDETNNFRRYNSQSARVLKVFPDSTIQSGAQAWATNMARTGTIGHDPNIHNVDPTLLENVYITSNPNMTARQVIDAWAKSPGHRRNMLSGTNKIGVGVAQNASGVWYVVARYKYDYSWNNEFLR